MPFGTDGIDVVGVVAFDVVGCGVAFTVGCDDCVLVLPDEAGVAVSTVGAGETGMSCCISGGGSGTGAGCITSWVTGTLIGLAGFTGLVMFVGFVALFVHVFDDSIHGEIVGGL